VAITLVAAALVAYVGIWKTSSVGRAPSEPEKDETMTSVAPIDEQQLAPVCSHCHLRPEPDVLPKDRWPKTVWTMVKISGRSWNIWGRVDPEAVLNWYQHRAPNRLDLPPIEADQGPGRLQMARHGIPSASAESVPFVSHMRLVDVVGDAKPELFVCDMRNGRILLGRGPSEWILEPIAHVTNPAHIEAVDLDADGRVDLVVANLGSFLAMDHRLGSVEWLRQVGDLVFERVTLADGLGRVADVQPADLDADGDWDLVVAEFGWRTTGQLKVLENRTVAEKTPVFTPRQIDGFHGCSHVSVTDLDGDQRVDIVALYSQEHERIRAYLNRGELQFDIRDLYRAPHPAWGHSGFQSVDLDRDGDVDFVVTNGDTYDDSLLKPYHGVRWLENKGDLSFEPHDLATMYGVYRAEAADMDGDGDMDIVACALAELDNVHAQYDLNQFESILWLEQKPGGEFVHHSFEKSRCYHPTLTLSDYDLDGDVDLFIGNGQFDDTMAPSDAGCIDLWENHTKQPAVVAPLE
jgi:hypothetical protein